MLNNGNKNNCGFFEDIVSYIYDEASASDRNKFETHLSHCVSCTDEFATVSAARYSVFEWRREEFDQLSTPEIFIPSTVKVEERSAAVGMLAGLKGFFAGARWPVTAFAAAAIILGMGFILMTFLDQSEQQVAANLATPAIVEPVNVSQPDVPQVVAKELTVSEKEPTEIQGRPARIKPVKRVPTVREKQRQELAVRRGEKPSSNKAPALTNYEENEDRSLRLADLLADGGVSQ